MIPKTYGEELYRVESFIGNAKEDPMDYETYEEFVMAQDYCYQMQEYADFLKQFPANDPLPENFTFTNRNIKTE